MACLDLMYNQNSDHHKSSCNGGGISAPPPMSPRISFSNDFADSISVHSRQIKPSATGPVSSDFEFSVSNYSMMSADELFFKGRLLPFKNGGCSGGQKTTLRDELLAGEDEEDAGIGVPFSSRPPKASASGQRWKGFLGLRKSHIGSRKSDKRPDPIQEDAHVMHAAKASSAQEMMNNGGSSSNCRDVEFRFQ